MKLITPILFACVLLVAASCGKTVSCVDRDAIDYNRYCAPVIEPVCGCNDITYQNPCDAERSGVRSWIGGPCL